MTFTLIMCAMACDSLKIYALDLWRYDHEAYLDMSYTSGGPECREFENKRPLVTWNKRRHLTLASFFCHCISAELSFSMFFFAFGTRKMAKTYAMP